MRFHSAILVNKTNAVKRLHKARLEIIILPAKHSKRGSASRSDEFYISSVLSAKQADVFVQREAGSCTYAAVLKDTEGLTEITGNTKLVCGRGAFPYFWTMQSSIKSL